MKLYKGKIPVIVSDLNEGWMRGAPSEAPGTGAVPRDFSVDPVEMRDSPAAMKLYDESEDDALYDAGDKSGDTLEHILLRALEKDEVEFMDQNGFPDCWCHSVINGVIVDRLKQNLPFIRFNGVAMATMMGRTNGGWCGLAMKFGRERGFPLVGTGEGQWPWHSRSGRVTPALTESMQAHRALEDWYDLGRAEWDQKLTRAQFRTCLINNLPTPSDYNRHGHSMLSLRWCRTDWGWGPLTWNSWKNWGYKGLAVLLNHVPDGSCALRSSTPTAA